ncbi:MAG: precorrin-6y C5,15-methyltransferase (decarboxylating) subunit CbiE [Paracoccaceae bacterium]|nr:precorrin-6y C5,15-methyltransferase (decarboxylating) subunit CbiE [Paracoccaceae bacterium]
MSIAMKPWLTVIGIGEDGMAGLSAAARRLIEEAEVIIGGDRHQQLAGDVTAERIAWPSPFDAMIETMQRHKDRRIVVLVTGDPLWYSVGARLLKAIPADEIAFHPQLSAFQWAACRLGWSLADVETLTAHGRPTEQVIPYFWPGARLIILTAGSETPGEVARLLEARGFGASRMTVLANLGGPHERRIEGEAADWAKNDPAGDIPAFHTLAVVCEGTPRPLLSRLPGLPDEAFAHDGVMTKREVRSVTLARLMPARGEVLWDIGCGCGSVAIEWMRAAPEARAIGVDTRSDRLALAAQNAEMLGTPKLTLVEGAAPEALTGLTAPDAVFIGGGLSRDTVAAARAALKPGGRLVANGVTLETEALLIALHGEIGGDLTRIAVERASPVGGLTGWRPAMPVVQWSFAP